MLKLVRYFNFWRSITVYFTRKQIDVNSGVIEISKIMFLLVVSVQVLSCVLIYIGCDTRSPSGVCTTTDSWMQNERLGNATGITDKVSKMRICRTHRFTSHNLPPPLLTPISSTGRSVADCCVRLRRCPSALHRRLWRYPHLQQHKRKDLHNHSHARRVLLVRNDHCGDELRHCQPRYSLHGVSAEDGSFVHLHEPPWSSRGGEMGWDFFIVYVFVC